jgi:glycosyltransferase involved in cell wall biosynthesis
MTLLSIITPVFQSGDYLPELLDSVQQIATPHEHIVFDGASTDGTVELLRSRDDAALRWTSEPDDGQMHAANKALRESRGDLVNWINGDNAYVPEAIDRAVALLDARPELDAVYGGFEFIDEHGAMRRTYIPPDWDWRRYLFQGDFVPTETIVFRRRLLDAVPQIDERFVDGADYDFYLRLLHGRRVERIPEPLILYRYHPESKTARDPWISQSEHMAIRLQWARGRRDRALMKGFDRMKRAVLPHISAWPRPFPADGQELTPVQRQISRWRAASSGAGTGRAPQNQR